MAGKLLVLSDKNFIKERTVNTKEAHELIAGLSQDQRDLLKKSHRRYLSFAYVGADEEHAAQAEEDREAFPQLLHFNQARQSVVSGKRASEFMAAVTSLPVEWCLAWDAHQFFETFGFTIEQAEQRDRID